RRRCAHAAALLDAAGRRGGVGGGHAPGRPSRPRARRGPRRRARAARGRRPARRLSERRRGFERDRGLHARPERRAARDALGGLGVGFGADASHDELPYARLAAGRFETEHYEDVLEPKAADLAAAVVRALDEPLADSSAIPTLAVAEGTARRLKVALSGIGGD